MGAQDRRSGARRDADDGAAGRARRRDRRRRRRRIRHPRLHRRRPTSTPASRRWRTYTIPGAGEPGNETWKDGKERWQHGGGSIWETATYDADTDTIYQGIGNAGPDYDPEYRPGDNKWAASVLALNPNDGKIKWGFQYTPNDPYDFDEISEHPDHQRQGQRRGPQARGARRAQRLLLCARPHQRLVRGRQAICRRVELDAGPRSQDRPAAQLRSEQGRAGSMREGSHGTRAKPNGDKLCPAHTGGKNWEPSAYNPELDLLYIPSIEGCNFIDHRRAEGLRRPGRHGEAARAVRRRRQQDHGRASTAASRRSIRSPARSRPACKLDLSELQRRAGDRRQSGLHRRAGRHLLGPRCPNPAGGLELQRRHRHQCAADHLCGQRQAVHRGAGGLAAAR